MLASSENSSWQILNKHQSNQKHNVATDHENEQNHTLIETQKTFLVLQTLPLRLQVSMNDPSGCSLGTGKRFLRLNMCFLRAFYVHRRSRMTRRVIRRCARKKVGPSRTSFMPHKTYKLVSISKPKITNLRANNNN